MKVKQKNRISNLSKIIPLLMLLMLLDASCFKTKDDTSYRNIIPEESFVSILKELHLSNGLLTLPDIRKQLEGDSLMIYIEIIESHGYSKETLDTTLQYYFMKNPKKLIRIYDRMVGDFTALQTQLQSEQKQPESIMPDQWEGEKVLEFPGDEESGNNDFQLTFTSTGYFSLRFTATVFPDDQTFNPSFTGTLITTDARGSVSEKNLYVLKYLKDGHPHEYKIEGSASGKTSIVLRGRFYNYSSDPVFGNSHARIENISFFYSSQ